MLTTYTYVKRLRGVMIMDEGAFAYPEWHFFASGNIFTGSWRGLNYKITPSEEQIHVAVWYGMLCSDLSEKVAEIDFPLSEEGIEQSRTYLWEQYLEMQKNGTLNGN